MLHNKELYQYLFAVCKTERKFTIYSVYPREAVKLSGDIQSSGIKGVVTVAFEADSPDPHDYLHVNDKIGEEPTVILFEVLSDAANY